MRSELLSNSKSLLVLKEKEVVTHVGFYQTSHKTLHFYITPHSVVVEHLISLYD